MGKVQFLSQTSKILKYYENDGLQNLFLLFMSYYWLELLKIVMFWLEFTLTL